MCVRVDLTYWLEKSMISLKFAFYKSFQAAGGVVGDESRWLVNIAFSWHLCLEIYMYKL